MRRDGTFSYERTFEDLNGFTLDLLDNKGFTRTVNGQRVQLSEKLRRSLSNSLNSVVYFATLPFPLADPAVIPRYLGRSTVREQPYHKIEVRFTQEGGGDDYEDVFVYWIHEKENTMDYLSYNFGGSSGGTRFRQAHNIRVVNEIRFADYHNYTSDLDSVTIYNYDKAFESGNIRKVSDVILENVRVKSLW
jgi:hypothetical protein